MECELKKNIFGASVITSQRKKKEKWMIGQRENENKKCSDKSKGLEPFAK